jgi:hypothetical protein
MFTRQKNWDKIKMWVEKGFLKPPPLFDIFKMHDTTLIRWDHRFPKEKSKDDNLFKKFFQKYPDADLQPFVSPLLAENPTSVHKTASEKFISRQKKYMKDGFSEDKAFQVVEQELAEDLQKEKFERSLFEGLAISNRSRSLMSYYEQEAEYEARQKLKQLQTTLPQYKRYQVDLEKIYNDLVANEDKGVTPNEDKMVNNYEPATCTSYI